MIKVSGEGILKDMPFVPRCDKKKKVGKGNLKLLLQGLQMVGDRESTKAFLL